jgi:hypothetical protein
MKRRRLWLADGSCIRLRPARASHVRAFDCVEDRTCDGRRYAVLNIVPPSPALDCPRTAIASRDEPHSFAGLKSFERGELADWRRTQHLGTR